jgi:predicted Zn-dependent protease
VILDAGFLISVDRSERNAHSFLTAATRSETALHTTEPVVAQVWRSGSRQVRLSKFLRSIRVHPLDDGKPVGQLLAASATTDVVDAHLVLTAVRLGEEVLTGDPDDIGVLATALGPTTLTVHVWP